MYKTIADKYNRRLFITTTLLLLLNIIITFFYARIWNYALDTILVRIINNTGHEVTNAGIYGCYETNWGNIPNGKSKTVRFPSKTDCAFVVTYKLNDVTKNEIVPRKTFTENIYYLGTNLDNLLDK